MHLQDIQAQSIREAIDIVRRRFGAGAIIIDSTRLPSGVSVRVAIDPPDEQEDLQTLPAGNHSQRLDLLAGVLDRHHTPQGLAGRLLDIASGFDEREPVMVLSRALARVLSFRPLGPDTTSDPPRLMICGPPGVGKTVVCVKLASRIVLEGGPAAVIGTDLIRAGAFEQLAIYCEPLDIAPEEAADAATLARTIAGLRDNTPAEPPHILIDTPGVNPHNREDIGRLIEFAALDGITPVMVLGAGRATEEAIEIARGFAPLRPRALVITGLDVARRLGAILAVADALACPVSEAGLSPRIGDGLYPLSALRLARLMMNNAGAGRSSGGAPARS